MTEREEIEGLKKELADLKAVCTEREIKFLELLLDINDMKRNVQGNTESIARLSSFFGGRSVEFRDRLMALESGFFNTIDFPEIEKIIGKSGDPGPNG